MLVFLPAFLDLAIDFWDALFSLPLAGDSDNCFYKYITIQNAKFAYVSPKICLRHLTSDLTVGLLCASRSMAKSTLSIEIISEIWTKCQGALFASVRLS